MKMLVSGTKFLSVLCRALKLDKPVRRIVIDAGVAQMVKVDVEFMLEQCDEADVAEAVGTLELPEAGRLAVAAATASPLANLTDAEKDVLAHVNLAWSRWLALGEKHPDDDGEFRAAIHQLQNLMAFRVARRVDPEQWWQPQ